jgi:8-oxo-dGTP diphosphatase
LPGGKIEVCETRWQALQRELKEEIDIQATAAEPYMQVYHPYRDRNILLDVWEVTAYRGLVSAREQQKLAWIDIGQIDCYRFPPADMPVLDSIANNRLAETKHLP